MKGKGEVKAMEVKNDNDDDDGRFNMAVPRVPLMHTLQSDHEEGRKEARSRIDASCMRLSRPVQR